MNQQSDVDDESIETTITAACRAIDLYCRQFFYDTGEVSARTFRARTCSRAYVDPFHTTTGLVIKTDSNGDGGFATEWTVTDYDLERFNGWPDAPYDTIYGSVGSYSFPVYSRRRNTIEVTAQWGWAAVPPQIKTAAELISIDLWKRRDAPFGITLTDFGPLRVSANIVNKVDGLVYPFVRQDRSGIA